MLKISLNLLYRPSLHVAVHKSTYKLARSDLHNIRYDPKIYFAHVQNYAYP